MAIVQGRYLHNFGVPPVDPSQRSAMLQPKPKHRFRVVVNGFGMWPIGDQRDITIQTRNIQKPNVNFPEQVVDAYNSKMYYAGKHEWQPITLTLYDDVTNRAQTLVQQQIQKQLDMKNQIGLPTGQSYKFEMRIQTMDGSTTGEFEEYFCEGCFIQSVNPGDFDYTASDPSTLEVTIRYDNCLHHLAELVALGREPVSNFSDFRVNAPFTGNDGIITPPIVQGV